MPSLSLYESFAAAARDGSFAAAARRLGVSASAIGKAIQRLEAELDVTLFQRTTRQLELTEDGRLLLAGLSPALDALDEAVETLRNRSGRIEGHLAMTAPLVAYHLLDPVLQTFLRAHPDVTLEMRYTDTITDLVAEGIDLGLRAGPLRDSSLKSRRLTSYRHGLFASPAYLDAFGSPAMDNLDAHARIALRLAPTGRLQPWLHASDKPLSLSAPRLVVNSIAAARSAALAGTGITWLPDFVAEPDAHGGHLVRVLPEEVCETGEFFLVWPASRAIPRRLRAFIDHLTASVPPGGTHDAQLPAAKSKLSRSRM